MSVNDLSNRTIDELVTLRDRAKRYLANAQYMVVVRAEDLAACTSSVESNLPRDGLITWANDISIFLQELQEVDQIINDRLNPSLLPPS